MTVTRLTKSGQPVMGTTILLEAEDAEGNPKGWLPVKIVGKLYGRGGSGDLAEIAVEWEDGGRDKGWLPVKIVGKLYGLGGNNDLVGIIVEWEDGGRQPVPWRGLDWRRA